MHIEEYLTRISPLSVHARFAIGLRIFERYVRLRGLEDESIWTYLNEMWQFPMITDLQDKLTWEKEHCDLTDYGLGDELPEELEEELYSLAINEDYFELWVTNVTELAWGSMLEGPDNDESLELLKKLLQLAAKSEVGAPNPETFSHSLLEHNNGWGNKVTTLELEKWQTAPCSIT